METKTGFTVFYAKNGRLSSGDCGLHSLEDLMAQNDRGNDHPVAWAAEVPDGRGGWPCANDLRAESIAAGRTIELIDGKYVARGVEEPKPAQTLGDLLRKAGQGLPSKAPTLDMLEAQAEPAFLKQLRDLVAAQGADGKWNHDGYMCGLYNGLELALAMAEGREPQYRSLSMSTDLQAPVSAAHPALSFLTLSPDLQPSSHLVAPAHGSALLRG